MTLPQAAPDRIAESADPQPEPLPAPVRWHVRFARHLRREWRTALTGAAAGALAWIGCMALGVPQLAGFDGHDFTPVAALAGALMALARPTALVLYGGTGLVALVVAAVAYLPVIEGPFHRLIRADAPPRTSPDAVFVLTEDVTTDSLLAPQSLDRLLYGAELVHSGIARLLVITTYVHDDGPRTIAPLPAQLHIARLLGIDSSRVIVVDSVASTRDEAVRGRAALLPRGIQRIAVVTSPAHSSRACRTFQRVGFVVTCMPARSRDVPIGRGALYRTEDRLRAFRLWLYETVAWAWYRRNGWV